jgi:hypothetical protein
MSRQCVSLLLPFLLIIPFLAPFISQSHPPQFPSLLTTACSTHTFPIPFHPPHICHLHIPSFASEIKVAPLRLVMDSYPFPVGGVEEEVVGRFEGMGREGRVVLPTILREWEHLQRHVPS